jgi:CHAD domain-containing protein
VDYRLKKREPLATGVRRVACEEIAGILQDLHACMGGGDPAKPVHDARKHLKKLAALLRLLRPAIGEEAFVREGGCFRRAARRLAGARDAEVCVATLQSLAKSAEEEARPALEEAHRAFATALVQHRQPARRTLESIAAALIEAAANVRAWEIEARGAKALAKGVELLYRRARKAGRKAAENPSTEGLHRWRQRTKEFGAALRLLRGMGNRRLSRLVETAQELSELLGDDHDLAVLADTFRRDYDGGAEGESAAEEAAALVLIAQAIETRRARLQKCTWKLGKRLFAEKPRRLAASLMECWDAWHRPGA